MIVALVLLNVVHPGMLLKKRGSEFSNRKEKRAKQKIVKAANKAVKQEKKEQKKVGKEEKRQQKKGKHGKLMMVSERELQEFDVI